MKTFKSEENFYPVTFVSEKFSKILNSLNPVSVKQPTPPLFPQRESSLSAGYLIIPLIIIFILAISEVRIEIAGIFTLISVLLIILLNLRHEKSVKVKYKAQQDTYKKAYMDYQNELRSYRETELIDQSPENNHKFRVMELSQILNKVVLPNLIKVNKKGASEQYFQNFLNKWFKGKIFVNYTIHDSGINGIREEYIPYTPDFIFQDESNLHIDIEIDEPYQLPEKRAIHYKFSAKDHVYFFDSTRDKFFTDTNSWIVIRFAEEQVVKYPNECCLYIADMIYELTGNSKYKNLLIGYSAPPLIKKWTNDEAAILANINFRESYLKDIGLNPEDSFLNKNIRLGERPNIDKMKKEIEDNGYKILGITRNDNNTNQQFDIKDDLPF